MQAFASGPLRAQRPHCLGSSSSHHHHQQHHHHHQRSGARVSRGTRYSPMVSAIFVAHCHHHHRCNQNRFQQGTRQVPIFSWHAHRGWWQHVDLPEGEHFSPALRPLPLPSLPLPSKPSLPFPRSLPPPLTDPLYKFSPLRRNHDVTARSHVAISLCFPGL